MSADVVIDMSLRGKRPTETEAKAIALQVIELIRDRPRPTHGT